MRFRKLRIAFSATCVVACVLLIALWVRSYWRWDLVEAPVGTNGCALSSFRGRLALDAEPAEKLVTSWRYSSVRIDVPEELVETSQQSTGNDMTISVSVSTIDLPRIISLPHFSVSVVLAILAAIPWLPARFSLRTLLLTITAVAVVLGVVVWLGH